MPRPGRLTPGKNPVPIVQEAGWATGPVRKISSPAGFDPWTVQAIQSRYTDCDVYISNFICRQIQGLEL